MGVEVLGQALGKEKTQFVVLAGAAQHVEQQTDTASGPFLVGDFQSPAFEQVVEVHTEVLVGLALHHAEGKVIGPAWSAVTALALIGIGWLG